MKVLILCSRSGFIPVFDEIKVTFRKFYIEVIYQLLNYEHI